MTVGVLTIADLHRHPADVAARLVSWQRGDLAEAVSDTLRISARSTFARAYTAWVWAGEGVHSQPAWALPVPVAGVEQFEPPGTMAVLARCLAAAADCGAAPYEMRLVDWDGFTGLLLPGLEPLLAPVALTERHPDPARVALAPLPSSVPVDGPPLELAPVATGGGRGLRGLAGALRAHPVTIALALLEQGWELEEAAYPDDLVDLLRHRGYEGPALPAPSASLAIDDDPCPRRRHARRLLRRLLHMRKVGAQYHTEFHHLARGVAPDDRADALQIGEALIRAGLLGEKPSVGQRHVYLRRASLPAIYSLIERGETADGGLAGEWTAPAPGGGR